MKNAIDDISDKLLSLEFKKVNSIKTKCLKYIVKIYCLAYNYLIFYILILMYFKDFIMTLLVIIKTNRG